MVHLTAATLRLPWDQRADGPGSSVRKVDSVASLSLTVMAELLLPRWRVDDEPVFRTVLMHRFLHALLRTQALQAASCQLAALAATLAAAAAEAEAARAAEAAAVGAARAVAVRSGAALTQPLRARVTFAALVAGFVYSFVSATCCTGASPELAIGQYASAPKPEQLVGELVAALRDSSAMEHSARGLLLAALLMPELLTAAAHPTSTLLHLASRAHLVLELAVRRLHRAAAEENPASAEDATDAVLRALLCGPCAQHAVLAIGLAALCEADGGPAFGTPPALLAALSPARCGGIGGEGHMAVAAVAQDAMVKLLPVLGGVAPLGRRGALALALRVGWLAVAAAKLQDESRASGGRRRSSSSIGAGGGGGGGASASGNGGAGGSGGAFGGGGDANLRRQQLSLLVTSAYNAAFRLLAAASDSPRWQAEATGVWRLLVAMAQHVLPYDDHTHCASIGTSIRRFALAATYLSGTDELRLPARPPPALAAALSGGLLPCLERLLRAAGQSPAGPEARAVRALLAGEALALWNFWVPLLAYGEARQAAALVVTVGKLLRRIDPRVFVVVGLQPGGGDPLFVLAALIALAEAAAGKTPSPEAAAAGGPSAASQQQLMRLLSCAACVWLPPLASLAQQALALAASDDSWWRSSALNVFTLLEHLLNWVCILAVRCEEQAGLGPAGEANGSAAGSSRATAAGAEAEAEAVGTAGVEAVEAGNWADGAGAGIGDGGWAALLLEGLGAVPLLGAVLELAPPLGEAALAEGWEKAECVLRMLGKLVEACHGVAFVAARWTERARAGTGTGVAVAAASTTRVLPAEAATAAAGAAGGGDCGGADAPRPVAGAAGGGAAAAGGDPAPPQLPWRPESLRTVAAQLRRHGQHGFASEAAEPLAAWLERGGGEGPVRVTVSADLLVAALPPPAAARRLLRTCAHPGCTNLDGDSEAGLPLQGCSRCGVAGYCGRPCQAAHWRAGHKRECEGRQRTGG